MSRYHRGLEYSGDVPRTIMIHNDQFLNSLIRGALLLIHHGARLRRYTLIVLTTRARS